jgi:hypothetical protein
MTHKTFIKTITFFNIIKHVSLCLNFKVTYFKNDLFTFLLKTV